MSQTGTQGSRSEWSVKYKNRRAYARTLSILRRILSNERHFYYQRPPQVPLTIPKSAYSLSVAKTTLKGEAKLAIILDSRAIDAGDRQHQAFAGISLPRLRTGIEDDDPKYHDHYVGDKIAKRR